MKIKVINGVNLNMLGIREKSLYGEGSYDDLLRAIVSYAKENHVTVECCQSNHEGEIVDIIQKCYGVFDGIIINAGAYTHTSLAILDALKAVNLPTVEVHLTDIHAREEYRRFSYISQFAEKIICGLGFNGYRLALEYFGQKNI